MLLLGVLADLAEMEKELLVERISSGLDEAKRKGKKLGRPKGSILSPQELLEKHPGVVKDLREGISLRRTVAFRKASLDTVQRVKRVLTIND